MFFLSGEDRIVEEVNEAFESRYLEAVEIVGRPLSEVTKPIPTDLAPGKEGKSNREYLSLFVRGLGSVMVELVYSQYSSEGKPLYLAAVNELFPPLHSKNSVDHPLFKSIFDKARDIILLANDNGELIQANETACNKLGYTRSELVNMSVTDISHAPIRSYTQKKWDDFIRTGVDEGEYFLETKEGDVIYAEYRAVANIHPGIHLSILRDLTSQKVLKRQEQLKSEAIETAINGFVFFDSDFQVNYANTASLDLWGYESLQEVENSTFKEFFNDPGKVEQVKEQLQSSGKWRGSLTARNRDGSEFLLELSITSMLGEEGSPLVWIASCIEQTELVETRQALKNSESRFRRLLESAPDAIFIIDRDGTISFCNSETEEMMGYKKGELIGKPVETLIPHSVRSAHRKYRDTYISDPHKRPMGSGLELKALQKDGSMLPVDIMLGPIEEDGDLNVLAIVRDISRYKEIQEKLRGEQEFTKLLHRLTVVANQAKSLEEALDKSVLRICEYMDWPVGHVYLPVGNSKQEFYPTDIWYLPEANKYETFRKKTMQTRFEPGEGMVGEVIETGKPKWYMDAHKNPEFKRRVPNIDLGIRACFGLPILIEDEVVGVLEFFSSSVMASDTLLLEKMATIGNQLGRLVERRDAENQLKQSEEKYRNLFDTALDGIFILDKNRLVDCNASAVEMFRSTREQLMNNRLEAYFPEQQPNGSFSEKVGREKVDEAFNGKEQFFEWRFRRPDGSEFDAEVSLIPMELRGQSLVQAVVHDITERKEAERLIQKNMELFSQLFQNSPVGVIMIDDKGKVINVNRSFKEIFGYELSEIKRKNIDDFIVPEGQKDNARSINERTFGGDSFQTEAIRIDKAGNEIPVLIGTVPVTIENSIIATFGIYVDISDRKNAESKLRRSLEEKEVLLKEIHHRVKNNLAVITGLLELQMHQTSDEKAYQKLQDSQARIHSMALVHEQLYQMEFFSSLHLDDYIKSLAQAIASTFDQNSTEVKLEFDLEPVELTLNQAVPSGLLLNEVLTNAYKHAFQGRDKGRIRISLYQYDGEVELTIADDGAGIPEEMMEGSSESLGMTLIHTLAEQLEGELEISNKDGASFQLRFPRVVE